MSTTSPAMMNAMNAVSSGTTTPPLRMYDAIRAAGVVTASASTGSTTSPPKSGRRPRAAGHEDPDLLLARRRRQLTDDPALEDHEDAVGERAHLFGLERDEQDPAALVALGDQPLVHELDRADVQAARRLMGEQQLRIGLDLARDADLLLVAA